MERKQAVTSHDRNAQVDHEIVRLRAELEAMRPRHAEHHHRLRALTQQRIDQLLDRRIDPHNNIPAEGVWF